MAARKLLILSVGYGQGHHAAAAALSEEFGKRGWHVSIADPCSMAHPFLFSLTQSFYRLCVQRAPWLWGITYAQTNTSDWRGVDRMPILRGVHLAVGHLLEQHRPDVVLCTYPLYAYMLDAWQTVGLFHGRYGVVVTDALEISSPWLRSRTPLLFVPDAYSKQKVCDRYGLCAANVYACGFPVRAAFVPTLPERGDLHFVYGAYRSVNEVAQQVKSVLSAFPTARITLLGGARTTELHRLLTRETRGGRLEILTATDCMEKLLRSAHVYIGKAGAATMFECYAALVPMVVNFALPGQEQGNLALLLKDEAGCYAESATELEQSLMKLFAQGGALWQRMRQAMKRADRSRGAAGMADVVEGTWPL